MRQGHHKARFISTGIDFKVFTDTYKTSVIIARILYIRGQLAKPVQPCTVSRRYSRNITAIALCDHFGSHCRIGTNGDLNSA